LHELAPPALAVALARRVSAYDACYLVLAEAANAVLVTADRALADLAPRSALLPYDGPP
jgi:predicted nucleic acid-binding protein